MIALLDTSIVVSLSFQETGHQLLAAWLDAKRIVPRFTDFGRGEFAAATSAKVRARGVDPAVGQKLLAEVDDWLPAACIVPIVSDDVRLATGMVARADIALRMPDALHIAAARRLCCPIVSFDRQQLVAAIACGIPALHPFEPDRAEGNEV